MNREFVCIVCPVGCSLQVNYEKKDKSDLKVSGNNCPKGENYAKNEIINSMRVLTTTAVIKNEYQNRIPVKTDKTIPKELLDKAMIEVNKLRLQTPVKKGDVLIENILGTEANLVASRSVE